MISIAKKGFLRGSIIVGILVLSFFVVVPWSQAQAVSASSQGSCSVLLIHLHGNAPATETCLAQNNRTVSPDTNTTNCNANPSLIIWSIYNGEVCFTGNGYLAIRLDGVYQIVAYTAAGWVKYYHGGPGYVYYYSSVNLYNGNNSPFSGSGVEITQVDIY